ncbi:Mitochondrial ribonuclease P protein 1 -like protein [Halotydeus destructor]|nr:Mitochondrial ribonuclease P protein 1 -like protein [Halotydeus destructor]
MRHKNYSTDGRPKYTVDDFAMTSDSPEQMDRMASVLALYNNAKVAPSQLTRQSLEILIECRGLYGVLSCLRYLNKGERLRATQSAKEADRHSNVCPERSQLTQGIFDDHGNICYGVFNNQFINMTHNAKSIVYPNLIRAAMFGQPLVFDFNYDAFMRLKDQTTLAVQVRELVSYNRNMKSPFDLHFCNYQDNKHFASKLNGMFDISSPSQLLITASSQSYADMFPKEKLVYLSPHADEELSEFDHDSVYIVGAFVDHAHHVKERHSFVNARQHGIKCAKLPLEKHLHWGHGNKCLNVNHVSMIMMDLKSGSTMDAALQKHVPRRKLKSETGHCGRSAANKMKRQVRKQELLDLNTQLGAENVKQIVSCFKKYAQEA